MLHGIAIQAHNTVSGEIAQTMLIPAARLRYVRVISADHPRTQWRQAPYSGAIFSGTTMFDAELRYAWDLRDDGTTRITADPVGFQVTDEEYLELLHTSELPRNVSLRFMRALADRGALLLGAGAAKMVDAPTMLNRALGETAFERLTAVVRVFENRIESRNWAWLKVQTPKVAEARKAGPPHNASDLPGRPDAEPKPEMFEVIGEGEVNVAFVKPEPEPEVVIEVASKPVHKPVLPGHSLTRPNGETYIARAIKGGADENLSDIEMYRRAAARGWNTLLFGPPGTGKTAALEVAFPGLITMLGTAETEPADFLGQYVQTGAGSNGGHKFTWIDGPLTRAMEEGKIFFLDECGLVDTRAMSALYSVMDGRGFVNITMNPARGIVTAKPGFGVVLATNPHAPGVRLSEALLSRCNLQLEVTSDYGVMRKLGVNDRIVDAAEHLAKLCETGEASWAPQARELLAFKAMEAEFGLVLAIRALLNQAPEIEREMVTAKLRERFGDLPAVRRIKPLGVG